MLKFMQAISGLAEIRVQTSWSESHVPGFGETAYGVEEYLLREHKDLLDP